MTYHYFWTDIEVTKHGIIKSCLIVWLVILTAVLRPNQKKVTFEECKWQEWVKLTLCEKLYQEKQSRETAEQNRKDAYEKYVKPYETLKEQHADTASWIRAELFWADNVSTWTAEMIVEDFIARWQANIGAPYKLWGKSPEAFDCSWLFTYYWYEHWIISEHYKLNVWNAMNLRSRKTAPVQEPKRWDILYFQSLWDHANHIAVITNTSYSFWPEMWFEILDASGAYGVSKRNIVINKKNDNRYYYVWHNGYKVHFATNPLLSFEREAELAGKEKSNMPNYWRTGSDDVFYLSHYNVGDPKQNDDSPCHWAAWADICEHLRNWWRSIALVAPYREKYGISFWDRVVLEWDASCKWIYTVLDEMNKRYRERCIVGDNSPHCIRWDIAYPYWMKWSWWNCYIKEVIKSD